MDLLVQHHGKSTSTKEGANSLTIEGHALSMNLENHLGNKVKVSFLPNQYYNDKIYTMEDYYVSQEKNGLTISMELKEGDIKVNYKIEEVVKIEVQEYFNRIEYKTYVEYDGLYNFCLYF